ncbi:WhiB family transcriptional regulator [Rhodococcus phenolicus]|uniref:WhiB family transcriptional regulator n=1 Tax=Rhodococcus phenolicus TaxID=263849 RepID=UPI0009ED3F2E|nr:WhiB family transcriptional regulator [Rhodococcus phenolicus]
MLTASRGAASLSNETMPLEHRIAHHQDSQWWNYAACLFYGPALFFGPDNESRGERQRREREAKRICATCIVHDRCKQFALTTRQQHGVWGGTSECERAESRQPVGIQPEAQPRSCKLGGERENGR